eukprot:scpid87434/ scgid10959/ 
MIKLVDSSPSVGVNPDHEGNVTLRLLLLSAYLFIGKEGEPRVGSGCDPEQSLRYRCWRSHHNCAETCRFYSYIDGDSSMRRYLGLRLVDGVMDTLAVQTDQAETELRRLSSLNETYKNFQTNFVLTPLEPRRCTKKGFVKRYSISIGDHSLSVQKNSKANISKLHKKAAEDLDQSACLSSPGPFQQVCGPIVSPSPFFVTFNDTWVGGRFPCSPDDGHRFKTSTCATGRLKRTYPVGQLKVHSDS